MPPGGFRSVPFALWVLILGGAGFAAGFFGPLTFNPDANQGPLLGIFISGPGGAALGLALWAISRVLGVPARGQWLTLGLFGTALIGVTLYYCMPEPALRGYALDVQILGCELPAQSVNGAIADWEKRTAAVTWAPPRAGWQNEARQKAQESPGVVLKMAVVRKNGIYEHRKPWDRGTITAKGWEGTTEQKSYYAEYAGDSCADYPVGTKSLHFTDYDLSVLTRGSVDWPPKELPSFLDLQVLMPIPDEYQKLVGN